MRKILALPILLVFLSASGCQSSPEQVLLEEHQDLNTAKTRVLAYVTKERCSLTVTINCADQVIVNELKDEVADADDKFDDAWANLTDSNIAAAAGSVTVVETTLNDNGID